MTRFILPLCLAMSTLLLVYPTEEKNVHTSVIQKSTLHSNIDRDFFVAVTSFEDFLDNTNVATDMSLGTWYYSIYKPRQLADEMSDVIKQVQELQDAFENAAAAIQKGTNPEALLTNLDAKLARIETNLQKNKEAHGGEEIIPGSLVIIAYWRREIDSRLSLIRYSQALGDK